MFFEALARLYTPCMRVAFWPLFNILYAYLSKNNEESLDHILVHCVKTRVLWKLFFALFGVFGVLSSLVRKTLLEWNGSFMGKKRKKAWSFRQFGRKRI